MKIDTKEILRQINAGEWVERFNPLKFDNPDELYYALRDHHIEETSRLVDIIKQLIEQTNV